MAQSQGGQAVSDFNNELIIDLFKQRDELKRENEALKKRIERLEEAGDSILVWMMFNRSHMGGMDVDSALREWKQAKKEAKP